MRLVYRVIYLIVTGLLGGSCQSKENSAAEYGCPHAQFRLDGQVLSDVSGEAVEGIRVSFQGYPDTTRSDGSWRIETDGFPCAAAGSQPCSLAVEDIDGADNGGEFEGTKIPLTLEKTEEGHSWYYGTFEQHDLVIRLALQEDSNQEK